jgi:hypothetical protein
MSQASKKLIISEETNQKLRKYNAILKSLISINFIINSIIIGLTIAWYILFYNKDFFISATIILSLISFTWLWGLIFFIIYISKKGKNIAFRILWSLTSIVLLVPLVLGIFYTLQTFTPLSIDSIFIIVIICLIFISMFLYPFNSFYYLIALKQVM